MSDLQNNEHNYCLSEIHLQNFRCFEDFRMALHPRLNVLVGANASGKTALLEGIRVGLSMHFSIFPKGMIIDITEDDLSIRFYKNNFEKINKANIYFSIESGFPEKINGSIGYGHKLPDELFIQNAGSLGLFSTLRYDDITNNRPSFLPNLSYYSVKRNDSQGKTIIENFGSRFRGYTNSLDGGGFSSYFPEWLKMNAFAEFQAKAIEQEYNNTVYQLVENSIKYFLPEIKSIYFDFKLSVPVVSYFQTADQQARVTQPYSYLSAGEQNLIALIADIALRCAILNPDMGIHANETPGIVLIDEIDLHLHPSWQRTVIPNLRKAFPNIQFIITTHSPQVISSVPKESLFILKDYQVLTNQAFTEGRDTNQLLYDVFGVEVRPADFREKLSHFYALLDAENPGEAQQQLAELEALWGSMDHEIVRAKLYLQDLLDEVVA